MNWLIFLLVLWLLLNAILFLWVEVEYGLTAWYIHVGPCHLLLHRAEYRPLRWDFLEDGTPALVTPWFIFYLH